MLRANTTKYETREGGWNKIYTKKRQLQNILGQNSAAAMYDATKTSCRAASWRKNKTAN